MKKRLLSIALTLALICSCVAISAFSVSATGPNLLGDNDKWKIGEYSAGTGVVNENNTKRAYYTDKIDVEPGATYTFKLDPPASLLYKLSVREYNADGECIGNLTEAHANIGRADKFYVPSKDIVIPDDVVKLGIGIFYVYDSTKAYEGQTIIDNISNGTVSVSLNKNVDTEVSSISMLDGAAMRIDDATNGIRFEAKVDKTAFDAQVEGGTVTEIGTLIAKADTDISKVIVDNAVDSSDGAKELTDDQIPVAKYAGGTTMEDVEDANSYVIYGSLVEIKPENATQKYVARAYVKYIDKTGGEHVMYASELSEARSIAEVAHNIVSADSTDGYYSSLCQKHKDVINKWAACMK